MNPSIAVSDSSNPNKWFVCPQANPDARTRLFLFPYAGAGPAVFAKWSTGHPGNVETWTAHYPGRGSRHMESPIRRLVILVEELSQTIQPLLDKPFAFFGHSFGGLVAFELGRHLRRSNLPQPQILFVSACGAPHLPDPHPPIHALPDADLISSLQQINAMPTELLHQSDLMQFYLPILRADFEVIETYHYTAEKSLLNCPIVAYGGLNDPRVSRERIEGWASQTNSSFKSKYFPGAHFFINTARESVIASITSELS